MQTPLHVATVIKHSEKELTVAQEENRATTVAARAQPKLTAAVGCSSGAQLSSLPGLGSGANSRAGGGNATTEVSTLAAEVATLQKYKAAASCSSGTYLLCCHMIKSRVVTTR